MPSAVANTEDTERHELRTCPEGFVELRRMTYGQIVQRREMMKLSLTNAKGSKDFQGEMAMANQKITQFEFKHCILDHNLEKADGTKLNLGNPVDFNSLDPRIGQEIESLIGKMNNFDEEEDEGN